MKRTIPIRFCYIAVFIFLLQNISSQQKVNFYAADSLKVTADLYLKNYNFPFILLFHQDGASRGEYREIARKLLNLDYNCLAVDLRSGGEINYIRNETNERAELKKVKHEQKDAIKDINASIDYINNISKKKVILFGSSYSASLCMIVGNGNPKVCAVIAFSPGEHFKPWLTVKDNLREFDKPVFVATTLSEYDYVVNMLETIPDKYKTIFKPKNGEGLQGAKALWDSNKSNDEYWLELFIFFKKLKEDDL